MEKPKLIDIAIKLNSLAKKSISYRLDYSTGESLIYRFKDRNLIESELSDLEFDKLGKDDIQVNLLRYKGLFYDREHFLKNCKSNSLNGDLAIVFFDESYLYYEAARQEVSPVINQLEGARFLRNAVYYQKFREDFKSSKIVSYHNSGLEFVVMSPEKGKLLIGYSLISPKIPSDYDLEKMYELYKNTNSSQEYQAILKGHIIDTLARFGHDQRFLELIKHLEYLVDLSDRDYEIFINKYSFEKIKKNFRDERDAYFLKIREIVNQLLSKVISIPISISASALAMYNLKDDLGNAGIVLIAFIIYSYFTSFLLVLLHRDVFELFDELNLDIDNLVANLNVTEGELLPETTKIFDRISTLHFVFILLQFILISLSITVIVVGLQYFSITTLALVSLCIIMALIQFIIVFVGLRAQILKRRTDKS